MDNLDERSTQHYEHYVADLEQKGQGIQQLSARVESVLNDLTRERGERLKVKASADSSAESVENLFKQFQQMEVQNQGWCDSEQKARQEQYKSLSKDISVCSS